MTMVHCAITRVVREGKEAEFEDALKRFVAKSLDHHGTTGAHLLRPTKASRPREYGILRSFRSEKHMHDFYASDLFTQWQSEVKELVEGEPIHRRLHGLEAFFRGDGTKAPPPRWKMAFVTWLGVFPVVLLWSRALPPFLQPLHPIVVTAVVTGVAVITLTWLVMPFLTRCFAGWLFSKPQSGAD
ncbi:MAG: antibiotic biosynthesis monooxygenase [Planctomycetota bacterium]